MSEWSHLPNAKHIDWVLASLKKNPKAWGATWTAAQDAARVAAWNAARDAARAAAGNAAWYAARTAAYGAIAALVAYDHCEKYLGMTPDELLVWWKLSDDPACILLLPMVKVLQPKRKWNQHELITD